LVSPLIRSDFWEASRMCNSFRFALTIGAAVLFTGCGGSQTLIGAPGAMPQASALVAPATRAHYKVVYSFGGTPNGDSPTASLIDVNGTLYGTTEGGGTSGLGTVFSITAGGTEKVLHSFGTGSDGSSPHASLINVKGTLYGTTVAGGTNGAGTVFSITRGGTEKVLYSFRGGHGGSDGADPAASLIEVKGTLYGTTAFGGVYSSYNCYYGCGTVFTITPSGTETVLHSFGNGTDGAQPVASLIEINGTLYGTTLYGGADGQGTVFTITPSGTETALHSFSNGTDGAQPAASLIEVKGTLYGTTESGGANGCNGLGKCGTVFSIMPSGTERVLHSFAGGSDGASPLASLMNVKGRLYGTTAYGGTNQHHCGSSCYSAGGTIFSITPRGTEKVLHSFANGSDGNDPGANLTDLGGTLYGTTELGGGSGCQSADGCGTVFAFKP
jgi:uncharacterized repeat protein (TIGR03803 family)